MVETERKHLAHQHLREVRRLEKELAASKACLAVAVEASGTSLTGIYGVGPVVAGLLIGYTGDVTRFPTRHHYAAYNGTAPIDASSGTRKRHRLNPRGNRMLNHALHLTAITRLRYPTAQPPRATPRTYTSAGSPSPLPRARNTPRQPNRHRSGRLEEEVRGRLRSARSSES
jgi:transposase